MRRFGVLMLAAAALFAGACGGGGSDKKAATNTTSAASGLSKIAAGSVIADVCGGKEALSIGAAFAQAAATAGGSVDYTDVAAGLRKAANAAPTEIKDDFKTVADALGPYLQVFQDAKGDYTTLYQNQAFIDATKRLADSEYTEAATRISTWFTDHCK